MITEPVPVPPQDTPKPRKSYQSAPSKLLALTEAGRATLATMEAAQRKWADGLGERIGEDTLRQASAVAAVLNALENAETP